MPAEARGSAYRTSSGWGVRWWEGDVRRRQSGFRSRSAALAYFRDEVRPRLNRRLPSSLDPTRLTFDEFCERYLEAHAIECEAVTIATLRSRLRRPRSVFSDVPMAQLERRVADVAAWRASLPPRYAWQVFGAFRQALEAAVCWDVIQRNPAKLAGANPQPKREEIKPFAADELGALLDELANWAPMVAFAAETGLRPGEWIALEHRDVDRDEDVVRVERSYAQPREGLAGKGMPYPKTGDRSRRSVPLSTAALAALDAQPRRIDTRLIFSAAQGGPLTLHNWRARFWRPALDAAGLDTSRRVYDLRHTFATNALAAGVTTFELSRIMGTSLEMVDRTYGHLARGSAQAIRAKLDAHAAQRGAFGR